jgi:hypothetical protein
MWRVDNYFAEGEWKLLLWGSFLKVGESAPLRARTFHHESLGMAIHFDPAALHRRISPEPERLRER